MTQDFTGKVAIVTGSFAGIGQATALLLAKQGASVTLHGYDPQEAEESKALFAKEGVPAERIHVVMGDFEQKEVREKLINETIEKFKQLDILVNNVAATALKGEKDFFATDALRHILNVNVVLHVEMTQLAMPHLMKTQGNVLNVSSTLSVRPAFIGQWYSLSKAALDDYTRVAASMYSMVKVRVNAVRVGAINTKIYAKHGLPKLTDAFVAQVNANTLMHRIGEPHEVAEVIAFLVNNKKASFVTGSIYEVDGGLSSAVIPPPSNIMELMGDLGYQGHGMMPKPN